MRTVRPLFHFLCDILHPHPVIFRKEGDWNRHRTPHVPYMCWFGLQVRCADDVRMHVGEWNVLKSWGHMETGAGRHHPRFGVA